MKPHAFETEYKGITTLHWSVKAAVETVAGWMNKTNKEKLITAVKGLAIGQIFCMGDLSDGEVKRVGYTDEELDNIKFYIVKE